MGPAQYLEDYWIHCIDCDETIDFWKCQDIEDTGHQNHKTRKMTEQETVEAIISCAQEYDDGCSCLTEEFMSSDVTFRQSQVEFISRAITYIQNRKKESA